MSFAYISDDDYQKFFAPQDDISAIGRTLADLSEHLLTLATQRETVDECLRLYHIVKGIRDRLDVTAGLALTRADALCDQPKVIGTITPSTPWGLTS